MIVNPEDDGYIVIMIVNPEDDGYIVTMSQKTMAVS
jgi:hypothetical protein